jgi:hypothetical protein
MRAYRWLWWSTLLAVSLPAIVLGLLSSPILAMVLSVTVVGVLFGLVVVGSDLSWRDWTDTAAGVVLIVGAAPALGRLTPFLLFLAAVTSPPLARLARPAGRDDGPDSTVDLTSVTTADVRSCWSVMTGAELCEMWSRSFVEVKSAVGVSQKAVGAALRADVLDEVERRNRVLFAEWLARRPSPASAPAWASADPPDS